MNDPVSPAPAARCFDSHLHVIDPRFPLTTNQGYQPDPFTVADYTDRTAPLGVVGGAVVSGSFQGFDQTYLRDALSRLGPGFVGVTQLPSTVDDETILELHDAGVRAIRLNLRRGGTETFDRLEGLAHRVHALAGWHTECYLGGTDLVELEHRLATLPRVSIDHLGVSRTGWPALLRLVDRGAFVKATGFGRVDFDVGAALREIAARNPGALLFGTDLPSTRAPRPFHDSDLTLVRDTLGEPHATQALHDNAVRLYRPPALPAHASDAPEPEPVVQA